MRRRGLVAAGFAVLLVASVFAAVPGVGVAQQAGSGGAQQSGQVIGRPDLSFATSTGELAPGASTELSIAVTNRGQIRSAGPERHESRVTTARGLTLSVDDEDVPIEVDAGTISVGNLPTGSVPTDPVGLSIANDAEPGTYEVPIEYEYQYTHVANYDSTGVEYRDATRTDTGELEIRVREGANFEIVSTDSQAQVGDTGDVAVTLENTGTQTARSPSVTVTSGTGAVTFDSGGESATAAVGEWAPGENRTVAYSVSVAPGSPSRNYTADLTVDYTDASGIDRSTAPKELTIEAAGEQTFAFENVSSSLHVGEEGTISGTVTNTGPQTASSVVVQYADNGSALVPVERSTAVGPLEPGADASFSLPVEVVSEARAGAKSVSFAVQYRNQDGDRRRYADLDVTADVGQERDQFDVAIQNRTVEAGSTQTVTVEATNNLDETVSDVEARLFAEDPLDAGDDNEGYVQSVEPGETVTLTYELSAAAGATAGKTYPVSFDFRYDDERGNSHLSNTIRVPVEVTSSDGGGLPMGTILLVGLVLVGVGAVVRYRRD